MSQTILRPPSIGTYTQSKGPLILTPEWTGEGPAPQYLPGYHLGDPESITLAINETLEPVMSNLFSVKTKRFDLTNEVNVELTARFKSFSPITRAVSMGGSVDTHSQEAGTDTFTFGPGIYDIEKYDIIIGSALNADSENAVMGEPEDGGEYLVDVRTGVFEVFEGNEITFDVSWPSISGRFVTGIASSAGIIGQSKFIGLNNQGVRSLVCLYKTLWKPSTAREMVTDSGLTTIEIKGTAMVVAGKKFGIGYEMDLPALS
ncbi:hypothetical protein PARHAE_03253 [Paracoccus haematequi]|uniref:Uncharacterized protein n=1 Tax=Paracoccus haematequi TaxID=2491866 RepID=A0A3S4DY33_9RHOB|nr:hypothetical protein [Paracoccus haematequi]VDS10042.1 hypothetical protein PARHAE_03253 [Paracoccus haematequi]